MLHPRITLLVRRSGTVQLGWDPETAVLLRPPPGADTDTLVAVLRLLDGEHSRPQVMWRASEYGITPVDMSAILAELHDAGLLLEPGEPPSIGSIRVHGRGPLSDAIWDGLTRTGLRLSRSGTRGYEVDVARWHVDFAVLADDLVIDPRLVADLGLARLPHLQVRIRDGKGIVGPLVIPGHTSCLRCADLTRCGYDDEWPHLAAQLLGRVGHASPAAVQATAALALSEIDAVLAGSVRAAPATLNATVELDLTSHRLDRRRWVRHQLCECARAASFAGARIRQS